jgi:hypothetical protein
VNIAANAFTLLQAYAGASLDVSAAIQVATQLVGGRTVATLTFSGSGIVAGSLADGRYTLTTHSNLVTDYQLGTPLDGDGDGLAGGDRVDRFFRLFGDVNGDGQVDNTDRTAFLASYRSHVGMANYRAYFDYDASGVIDQYGYNQFLLRYKTRLNPDGTITILP